MSAARIDVAAESSDNAIDGAFADLVGVAQVRDDIRYFEPVTAKPFVVVPQGDIADIFDSRACASERPGADRCSVAKFRVLS